MAKFEKFTFHALRIGKPAAGLGGGMRGGRLNDEPIVLPRGARAHTANERFLHGGGTRNHKSDEPVRHRTGQSQFWWRSVVRGRLGKKYAPRRPPPNKLRQA